MFLDISPPGLAEFVSLPGQQQLRQFFVLGKFVAVFAIQHVLDILVGSLLGVIAFHCSLSGLARQKNTTFCEFPGTETLFRENKALAMFAESGKILQ
jgi:hypothetical protein